jgi:hypothetical protein
MPKSEHTMSKRSITWKLKEKDPHHSKQQQLLNLDNTNPNSLKKLKKYNKATTTTAVETKTKL